jgi:hypothetical protein
MKKSFANQSKSVLALTVSIMLGGLFMEANAQTAPSTYSAYTGTDAKAVPPAPTLGPANSVITDPTFGSKILRVTDPNSNGGESFISTDAGSHRTWNANSTAIKLSGPHGDGWWLEFDPTNFKVGDGSATPKIHSVPFGATWEWSSTDPDIMYFLNGNKIAKFNKSTGVTTNLGGPSTGEPVDYMAVVIGQDNWVCAAAGSGNQDAYTKIFCLNPVSPGTSKYIDVANKTINGVAQSDPNWPTSAAGQVIGIHGISGGTGANWLPVTFHQQSWGGNGDSVFDLATNTWSLVTNGDNYWSGHISMGNGTYANASGSQSGTDSRGMVLRNPDNLMNSSQYRFVGQPPPPANGWCDADHNSWLNSLTNPNAPILSSRYGGGSGCTYAWTGEISAIAVDGSNTVWRFAHNHTNLSGCYYGEGFAQISNDGKWALFSSYWDGTLGSDTAFGCSNRIDTFVVSLTGTGSSGSGTTTPPPSTPPSGGSTTTPPSGGSTTTPPTGGSTTTAPAGGSTTTAPAGGTATSGRVEQNGSGVTYTGTWSPNSGSFNSGGSAVLSMTANSTATLSFNGTGATWIGYQDQWSGIAQVYVDGALKAQVDTYSATIKAQSPIYTVSGLSSGPHTMTIMATGQQSASSGAPWVWVDAFDVGSAASSGTPSTPSSPSSTSQGRAEDSNAAVQWSGSWSLNTGSFNSGSSAKVSMTSGSRATFTFTGTSVSWIAYRDQWTGIANVYIDGSLTSSVDTYSSSAQAQAVAYTASGLTLGTHTIAIGATGTKNANSNGSWVWVDAFDYVGSPVSSTTSASNGSTATSLSSGMTLTSTGGVPLTVGSAEVIGSGGEAPSGLALVSYRQNGVMVSEAGVPASVPMLRGRIDAEIGTSANTGFAVANPNDSAATVSFFFTDSNGTNSGTGSMTLPPHGQLARFLNEAPFSGPGSFSGTLTFSSDLPVSAIALHGLTNERSEFLLTTLPIANPDVPSPATAFFPHLVDGGGWSTQFVLVNPTDSAITGTLRFLDQTGQAGLSMPYQIAARSAWRYATQDSGTTVSVGSAQAIPDESNIAPVAVAIFSLRQNGITISQAGVPSLETGTAFRMFVETTGDGAIRTGIGIVNPSAIPTTIELDLSGLDGTSTGLKGTVSIPAFGQRAFFFDDIAGFATLPKPFKGFVRMFSQDGVDLAVIGLRGLLNERSDFLMTTTAPTNENSAAAPQIVFPQVANGGGFLTEFVLYNGVPGEPASGNLDLRDQSGNSMDLTLQ